MMTTLNNNKDFNEILHRCVQAVERGQITVEACVAQFPEYPELGDLLTLAVAMREMPRPMMSAAFTAKTQQRLATQLRAQTARRSAPQRRLWVRLATVFGVLAILLFIGGGFGLRRASASALPGDSLYSVKRSFERADVVFSGLTGDRVAVLYHVAQERLKEVDGLSKNRRPIEEPVLSDMARSFQEAYIEQPDAAKRDLETQAVGVFRKAQAQGVVSPAAANKTLGEMAISPTVFNQPVDLQTITPTANAVVENSPTSTPTATASYIPTLTPTDTPSHTPQASSPITATVINTAINPASLPTTSAPTNLPVTTAAPTKTSTHTPKPTQTQNPTATPTSTVPAAMYTPTTSPVGVQPFTTAQVVTNAPPTAIPTNAPATVLPTTAAPTAPTSGTPANTTTESPVGTVTVTATDSGTATADLPNTPTNTPSDEQTAAPTGTATATFTTTPTFTRTPTRTPTFTRTPRPTRTPTHTPTATSTPTATLTPTMTYTPTNTPPPTLSPNVFNGCPPEGDGGDATLNRLRNRTDEGSYQPKSLDDLLAANGSPTGISEGQAVTIEGNIVLAQQSGPEAANCHSPTDLTWRIWVASQPGQLPKSVVAGITPRIRANHPGWTLEKLSVLVAAGGKVRVSGWLLLDPEHSNDVGKTRGTLWEVHPAMQIAVQKNGAWMSLDEYQP